MPPTMQHCYTICQYVFLRKRVMIVSLATNMHAAVPALLVKHFRASHHDLGMAEKVTEGSDGA